MRQYKQHTLKANKASFRPTNILYLDVETYHRTVYTNDRSFKEMVRELYNDDQVVRIRKALRKTPLDLDTLRTDYSLEELKDLKGASPGIAKRDGFPPDSIAQEFGFSYDGFINLLKDTPRNSELKKQYEILIDSQEDDSFSYDSKAEHHYFDFGWTCHVRKQSKKKDTVSWQFHNDAYSMWKYIESLAWSKTVLWVFGHNVFFDLQASDFFNYFTKWGWNLEFTYDQGMTYILVIRKGNKTIKALSTTNFYPFSLKKLGDFLCLPKKEVCFETTPRDELISYCHRDVEICKFAFENWLAFLDDNDLGNFALTRASQAFTAYRHRFMPKRVVINDDEEVKNWERSAYFGGRTEAFQIGEIFGGPFITLDVNSMYPFVMKTCPYPVRFLSYSDNPRIDLIEHNLAKYAVVAEIEVETMEPCYPILFEGKLIFPIGSFTCWVCTRGLAHAIKKEQVKRIKQIAYYEKDYIFESYVDYFMDLKKKFGEQNEQLMRQTTKIFLNALYGKFGQKKPILIEEEAIDEKGYWKEDIADLVTGKMLSVTQLFNKRYATYGYTSSAKSFPAIAAHITEDARFHLWNIITGVGRDKVLYCDTDSVKIRKSDLPYVNFPIDQNELGALKNESETEKLIIYGPKDYETEKGYKVKGVPKSAEKIGEGQYKYMEFPRQNTHLRAKNPRYYIVKEKIKYLDRHYTKGEVLESGKVIPFRF